MLLSVGIKHSHLSHCKEQVLCSFTWMFNDVPIMCNKSIFICFFLRLCFFYDVTNGSRCKSGQTWNTFLSYCSSFWAFPAPDAGQSRKPQTQWCFKPFNMDLLKGIDLMDLVSSILPSLSNTSPPSCVVWVLVCVICCGCMQSSCTCFFMLGLHWMGFEREP